MAATQSQLVQMQSTNSTLEQKYSRAASELAAAKIECQRMEVEVKQVPVEYFYIVELSITFSINMFKLTDYR